MSRSVAKVFLLSTLWMLPPALASAADVPPSDEAARARALVRRLGDDSFREREQASRELFRLGLAGKQALLDGSRDPDLEVRRRCRELLPAVLAADLEARIQDFVADRDGRRPHDLPGWQRYRQIVGEDAAARLLFGDVLRGDSVPFLEDTDRNPEQAGELAAGRCRYLQQKLYGSLTGPTPGTPLDLHEVASVLIVLADPRVRTSSPTVYAVSNFLYQDPVRSALTDDTRPTPFRKLVLAWMRRQMEDEAGASQVLQTAQNLNLPEGLDLALEAVRARKLKGSALGVALTTVGKLGSREQVPVLESYLADTTSLGRFVLGMGKGTTEVRDVALAMIVHLTGQDHRDYGFVFSRAHSSLKFYPLFLGFADAPQRLQAQQKWKTWSAAHPLTLLSSPRGGAVGKNSRPAVRPAGTDPLFPPRRWSRAPATSLAPLGTP